MLQQLHLYYRILFQSLIATALFSMSVALPTFGQSNSVKLLDGNANLINQYNSVTAAYGAIPATISQAYIIELTTTYTGANETLPLNFINKTGASVSNTITVRPEASATNISISGSVSGDPIFYLNNADFIHIDGRPGSSGNSIALTLSNTATSSNSNTVELANGASDNVVRNCTINNATSGSAGRNVAILAGTAGNSDNLIYANVINAGRYAINLNGNTSNPNENNTVKSNTIIDPVFVGIWLQSGVDGVVIDSNEIYSTNVVHDADYGVILFDTQSDTAIVSRNTIRDLNSGNNSSANMGIQIRSVAAGGGHYVRFENNFIDLSGSSMSSSQEVIGIKYAGSNATAAGTYFNTIRIGGTLSSGGTSGDIGSACLQNVATSTSNNFDSKNNILINNRSGGTSGIRHVCIDLANTNGAISGDYNIYNSSTSEYATLNTTLFTSFPLYQTAVAPSESNSNTQSITFAASNDLHLANSMAGNPSLSGSSISGISIDIDGESRSVPVIGADEISLCSGVPVAGQISGSDSACINDTFNLSLTGSSGGVGIDYTWQSRPINGTFSNIPSSNFSVLSTAVSVNTEFRCILECTLSNESDTSDTFTVTVIPNLSITGISASNIANSYSFSPTGGANITSYHWDFGDGSDTTISNPTHLYTEPGIYNVELIVSNACGADTVTTIITVDCFNVPQTVIAHASDTAICSGDSVMLTLSGITSSALLFYDLQWQRSIGGGSFADLTGEVNDTLLIAPGQTAEYRCEITCQATSTSTTSSAIEVSVSTTSVDGIAVTGNSPEFTFSAINPVNVTSFSWDFGDGNNSTLPNPTHTFTSIDTFSVIMTAFGLCDTITTEETVIVECLDAPDAGSIEFTKSGFTYSFTTDADNTNSEYTWIFGDGTDGSGLEVDHTYPGSGSFSVQLIVENDCGADTAYATISITIGVSEINSELTINLFPNPTDDYSFIETNEGIGGQRSIKIINLLGETLYQNEHIGTGSIRISADELNISAGTYFIEVRQAEYVSTRQWIVR